MCDNKIAIIADSCSDIPKEYIKDNVFIVPIRVIYPDREYYDRVDISPEDVYSQMPEKVPTTSLPSAESIKEVIDRIVALGYERIISISISSALSGTFNMLRLIAKEEKRIEISVLDSKNIGIGCGIQIIYANKLIEEGLPFDEIIEKLNTSIKQTKVYFSLAGLEYLKKGGRIGKVAAIIGSFLRIKPIITCNEDGAYTVAAKLRGRENSIAACIRIATEYASKFVACTISVAHGGAKREAAETMRIVKQKITNCTNFFESELSPALGVHTGPGLVGICVQPF